MASAATAVRSAPCERGWLCVDLLQTEDVGVEHPDRRREPIQVDSPIGW